KVNQIASVHPWAASRLTMPRPFVQTQNRQMTEWKPTPAYQKIAEANREYYSKTADLYESTETCVSDPAVQSNLEADLDRVLAVLQKPPAQIVALDACGGSGNI